MQPGVGVLRLEKHRRSREPRFVTPVADFFDSVGNAPRAKMGSTIRTNEFGPRCHRIIFHQTQPFVFLTLSCSPAACFARRNSSTQS
jgi:hypothetical protein